MDAYTGFARVYDLFMDDIPYDAWGEYLTGLLPEICTSAPIVHDGSLQRHCVFAIADYHCNAGADPIDFAFV